MPDSKIVLMSVSVAFSYFIWGVCNAILAPFFPIEAELKGATISQSGFVFGIYSLVGFVFSPLVGKYGTKMSQAYLYNLGAFIQSLCTLSFWSFTLRQRCKFISYSCIYPSNFVRNRQRSFIRVIVGCSYDLISK